MTSLRALVIVAGLAAAAHAQPAPAAPATSPDARATLSVTLGPGPVDRPALYAALADELGVALTADAPGTLGAVAIELVDGGRAIIRYLPPSGPELVRAVNLPQGDDDRRRLLVFVAGNLVRDQLDSLAPASLITPPYDAPIEAAIAPPVPVVPVITVAPPRPPAPARDPERGPRLPMSLGLVPPFATDRLWSDDATVGAGVHALVGTTARVRGVSLAGIADITRDAMVGVQVAGIAAIDRDLRGISVGGIASIARTSRGAQLGGIAAIAQDARAVQIGGVAAVARDLEGLQVGGVATAAAAVRGAQLAGVAAVAQDVHGLQVGGVVAVGAEVRGVQIAPINVARHMRGLQLGVINVSDDLDGAPIGVINIVRNGPVMVDAWAESSGVTGAALRHGSRAFHTIYAVAAANDGDRTPLVGLGFGLARGLGRHALDIDALAWQTHLFDGGLGLLSQLRATVALDLGPIDLLVGGAINVQIDDMGEGRDVHAYLARDFHPSSGALVSVFPTATIGARLHLHRPR